MTTATLAAPADAGLRALPGLLHKAEGWAALRAALTAGRSGTVDGAWGSSASLAAAALATDAPGTLLVVVPSPADVSAWVEDIASFTGTRPPRVRRVGDVAGRLQQGEARPDHHLAPSAPSAVTTRPRRSAGVLRSRRCASRCRSAPTSPPAGARSPPARLSSRTNWPSGWSPTATSASRRSSTPASSAAAAASATSSRPTRPTPCGSSSSATRWRSIRTFAAGSQRSLEKKSGVVLIERGGRDRAPTPLRHDRAGHSLTDYLPAGSWVAAGRAAAT